MSQAINLNEALVATLSRVVFLYTPHLNQLSPINTVSPLLNGTYRLSKGKTNDHHFVV